MNREDPVQVMYHLSKTIESQTSSIDRIQEDIHEMRVDIALMKQNQKYGYSPSGKERLKDSAAGGGMGALLFGLIVGAWEYFSKN